MTKFQTGQEKIQQICSVLRKETLEPAQEKAREIIAHAEERAEGIILEAKKSAEKLLDEAKHTIDRERKIFQSSLTQAAQQSVEALRQTIEHRLFNEELHELVVAHTAQPQVIANLINVITAAIEKEGIAGDLAVIIPGKVSAKEVALLLSEKIISRLKDGELVLGDFAGGIKIRLESKKMTLDMSDQEIEALLSRYIRKDFRKYFFNE